MSITAKLNPKLRSEVSAVANEELELVTGLIGVAKVEYVSVEREIGHYLIMPPLFAKNQRVRGIRPVMPREAIRKMNKSAQVN